jgi:allantoinase
VNNDQLKEAFISGVLDFITTDHSPAPPSIKEMETGNLKKAWGGIAGIQFLLNGSWTALKDTMTLEQFIPLITSKPADFIKAKNKGTIEIGKDADFVIWNPEESEIINEEDILFRYKISPYIGQNLYGTVSETIVNGETVYQNKSIKSKNKGQWLLQK